MYQKKYSQIIEDSLYLKKKKNEPNKKTELKSKKEKEKMNRIKKQN